MRRRALKSLAAGIFLLLAGLFPFEANAISKARRASGRHAAAPPSRISVFHPSLGAQSAASAAPKIPASGLTALAASESSQPQREEPRQDLNAPGAQAGRQEQAGQEGLVERLGAQSERVGEILDAKGGDESAHEQARKLADLEAPEAGGKSAVAAGPSSSGPETLAAAVPQPGERREVPTAGPAEAPQREESRRQAYLGALRRAIAVSAAFAGVQFLGSHVTGSVALLSDALHLSSDLAVSAGVYASLRFLKGRPSPRRDAAVGLASAAVIAFGGATMGVEAFQRYAAPVVLPGLKTFAFAFSGLAANAYAAWQLRPYERENLSLKGAYWHAATDMAGSVAVIFAAFFSTRGLPQADPIASFLIVLLIAHTAWGLARSSWKTLRSAKP